MLNTKRSETSLHFQSIWAEARSVGELIPLRSNLHFEKFQDLASHLVFLKIDLEQKKMPILMAGIGIRDMLNFELTGKDFVSFDNEANVGIGWKHRQAYHDHPCGRLEFLTVGYEDNLHRDTVLTLLPVAGNHGERYLLCLVEEVVPVVIPDEKKIVEVTGPLKAWTSIDIGAGIPDL